MTKLINEITINSSTEKIWNVLSDLERLDKYDPTVKKSSLITSESSELGAKRKVDMKDGKNWFEEKVTVWKLNEALTYQLTACSFPIHRLKHSYSFEKSGNQTKVRQVMEYDVKFGFIGKVLDKLMIRKQTDNGIKKFFAGLKNYVEKNN
jgi:ribosome-associated toxin RatA of RatAB toxin-antitoxin module